MTASRPAADELRDASHAPPGISPLHVALLERAREGAILVDAHARVVYGNAIACQLLHYPAGGLNGVSLEAVVDVDLPYLKAHAQTNLRIPVYTRHRNVVPCEVRWAGESQGLSQILFEPAHLVHADEALRALTVGTATAIGDDFIHALARHVALVLDYRFAMVGEIVPGPPPAIRSLALWENDRFLDVMEYRLEGTPCEQAVRRGACFFPDTLIERFPHDSWLRDVGAESYLGMPILNVQGDAVGIISAIHTEPKQARDDARPILSIFAARAAAEFERKRAEIALRESERRYRRLVEDNPDAIIVYSNEVIHYANETAARLIGAGRAADILGKPVLDFVHPSSQGNARERMKFLTELNETPPAQLQKFMRLDGEVLDGEVTGIPIEVDGVKSVLAIVRDVTENLLAQESLRASEARFRTIYEQSPVMMHSINEDNILWSVNDKWLSETGYSRDEVLDRPLTAFFTEASRERAATEVNPRFWRDGHIDDEPFQLVCRDGTVLDILMSCRAITESDGRRVSLSVVRNITEQRRAQEAQLRLTTAIEQAAEAIVITDTRGAIVYVNPAFERITGWSREEAIGATPAILRSGRHDEAFYADLWNTIAAGDTWYGRFQNRKKDGTIYQEEATISPVRDGAGHVVNFVAVKRDITREVALETQWQQSQKMEAIGQLAGGIAHDFNNLLQAIMAHATLGAEAIPQDEPARGDFIEIHKAAQSAASLTRQLLAFSRRQVLQSQDLDLNEVVDYMLMMIRRVIGENIELRFIPAQPLATVHIDPHQMGQVLMNLCVNARDAMLDGGTIRIETSNVELDDAFQEAHPWSRPGKYVLLTVSDTGEGMDESTVSRVFEPFFTTKEIGRGTGLGLATVYGIVKQHNGLVHVYSEPGRGTAFKIYFPQITRKSSALRPATPVAIDGGHETILLAEDEPMVRVATTRVLERSGYTVIVASDGVEAVAAFKKHARAIDLALLDIAMPEMGGLEAARAILEIRPDVKVLFCSGYGAGASANVDWPHRELIEKPYAPSDLLRRIRTLLDPGSQDA